MSPTEDTTLLMAFETDSHELAESDDRLVRHQGLMGLIVCRLSKDAVLRKDLESWCEARSLVCTQDTSRWGRLMQIKNQVTVVLVALILKGLGPQVLDWLKGLAG